MYAAGFLGIATMVSRLCNIGLIVVLTRSAEAVCEEALDR